MASRSVNRLALTPMITPKTSSTTAPGANVAGPMWSMKHQAPTVRRWREGSARRTRCAPTWASRLAVTSTGGATGLADGSAELGYRPDRTADGDLTALAALSAGGRVFGED